MRSLRAGSTFVLVVALAAAVSGSATGSTRAASVAGSATVTPVSQQISTDPFTTAAQHQTEVESDAASYGSVVVAAFQAGRYSNSRGSSGTMWATSTDGGSSWTSGPLPGLTAPSGAWAGATDPSVAYDAAHATWLIASVMTKPSGSGYVEGGLLVSASTDGTTWSSPVTVSTAKEPDKAWLACDNVSAAQGSCYAFWTADAVGAGELRTSRSTDGGRTWSAPVAIGSGTDGYNVQPVVRPDGTLVAVATDSNETRVIAYTSTDQAATWSGPTQVAGISYHSVHGGLRVHPKPTVTVAPNGTVYAAWSDCRFRSGCPANDIVLTSSTDGVTWSPVSRVNLDPATETVDHFLPALAAQPDGGTLGLAYYWYPNAGCTSTSTCTLNVSYVGSTDGGATWTAPIALGPGSMLPKWLPKAAGGRMVGDYFGLTFSGGNAVPVVAAATAPVSAAYREAMWSAVIGPNTVAGGDAAVMEGDSGVTNAFVPVTLASPQSRQVTVDWTTADGTATAGSDYGAASGTLVFPAGDTSESVVIPVYGDTRAEPSETVRVLLSHPTGVAVSAPGTLRIVDEEGAPRLSVDDMSVVEGNAGTQQLAFPVRLSAPSDQPVTVTVATRAGTATAGSDYQQLPPTQVTLPAGTTTTTVNVPVTGDTAVESNETLTLALSAPVGAVLADAAGLGTIVDDDGGPPAPPPPAISVADATLAEGDSGTRPAVFAVTIPTATTAAVQVSCHTVGGSATSGVDFRAVRGTTVTIPAGSTRGTVSVAVVGDTAAEGNETFRLVCAKPVNAGLADGTGTGTIVDDDLG